ncbi:SgcJ/EcaC family oxidoreductase [Pseudonocardia sp. TRM90224]|uniref:SgcJ/EcaC family oxidoreductase n=1 Tax=Pseudonocardia sp. TRM90224 TaxID=2812678 RepID=UPI001E55F639|nr:SgcJ/EcaC family oxidoreductase [Pseudonocardia sp. TRM90224]
MTENDNTEAVRDVLRQAYSAWADNDADAFAALYTDDATVVMPGVFHPDRATIHGYMSAGFAGPLKGSRAVDEERSLRVLGDSAIVISRSIILMAGESDVPDDADARAVTATWVLTRTADGWKIAAYSNAPEAR